MADVSELNGLKKEQLVELGAQVGVELDPAKKNEDLINELAPRVTPEAVAEYKKELADREAAAQPEDQKKYKTGKMKYYRSPIAGLEILLGYSEDETSLRTPDVVRFQPLLFKRFDGDISKFGFLATDIIIAQEKAEADFNVVEITAAEYKKHQDAADDESDDTVKRTGY